MARYFLMASIWARFINGDSTIMKLLYIYILYKPACFGERFIYRDTIGWKGLLTHRVTLG